MRLTEIKEVDCRDKVKHNTSSDQWFLEKLVVKGLTELSAQFRSSIIAFKVELYLNIKI